MKYATLHNLLPTGVLLVHSKETAMPLKQCYESPMKKLKYLFYECIFWPRFLSQVSSPGAIVVPISFLPVP